MTTSNNKNVGGVALEAAFNEFADNIKTVNGISLLGTGDIDTAETMVASKYTASDSDLSDFVTFPSGVSVVAFKLLRYGRICQMHFTGTRNVGSHVYKFGGSDNLVWMTFNQALKPWVATPLGGIVTGTGTEAGKWASYGFYTLANYDGTVRAHGYDSRNVAYDLEAGCQHQISGLWFLDASNTPNRGAKRSKGLASIDINSNFMIQYGDESKILRPEDYPYQSER